jgi:hypothetical protein
MIEKIAFNFKLYNEYIKKISNIHEGLRIFLANSEIKNTPESNGGSNIGGGNPIIVSNMN